MKFIPCNYDAWDEAVDKSRRKYSRKTPTYKKAKKIKSMYGTK